MEEHYQAYFVWKSRGMTDAWCWHVDAHLDIGDSGLSAARLQAIAECRSGEEVREHGALGSSYLPWGGLHCGNYLYPAIKEGMVSRLTWVIPPDLPEAALLAWARLHLNQWYELSPEEFYSLSVDGERVHGTLLGIPFEMGTLEALSVPEVPVLLDVDIDYFLTEEGEVWQDPAEWLQRVKGLKSCCTTVAYSVAGGYTPEPLRTLAQPFLQGKEVEVWGTHHYQAREVDRLAALVRCHRYDEAVKLSEGMDEVEAGYLRGSSLHALKRYEDTLVQWRRLLARQDLPNDARHTLHTLCADLCLTLEQPEAALEHALAAQKLDRSAYAPCWSEAQAREGLGQIDKAVKAMRKTVKLSEGRLFCVKALEALARAYRRQGKQSLAVLETGKLQQLDPQGAIRALGMVGL